MKTLKIFVSASMMKRRVNGTAKMNVLRKKTATRMERKGLAAKRITLPTLLSFLLVREDRMAIDAALLISTLRASGEAI